MTARVAPQPRGLGDVPRVQVCASRTPVVAPKLDARDAPVNAAQDAESLGQ